MTAQIALVLAILAGAVILFLSERLRMDVVALLVLVSLALTGLVTPAEALSGFSSPAVVTVWAMFILSGALYKTGVANRLGRQVLRLAGDGEYRLVAVIMLTAAVMSAFMNNVGVAALMLPVVMDIARRTGRAPSRLLMPLAYAALMGGLLTLIGTPPNILISDVLRMYELTPFGFFDFVPVGAAVLVAGMAFMVLVGRRILPMRDSVREGMPARGGDDLTAFYGLETQLFVVRLPDDSLFSGRPLAASRLGSALGFNVVAIVRNGETHLAPDPGMLLIPGDRLLVEGQPARLAELRNSSFLTVERDSLTVDDLVSADVALAEASLSPRSALLGQTLLQIDFRTRFGVNVLAIWRAGVPRRTNLQDLPLQPDDVLLIQGAPEGFEQLRDDPNFMISRVARPEVYRLDERLLLLAVPDQSILIGRDLAESDLADAFGLSVLGIMREDTSYMAPAPTMRLQAGDRLLVAGREEDLLALRGIQQLEIDVRVPSDAPEFESERIGLAEAVLSPHSTLAGKNLREIHFRDKYGLSVVAIWREGKAFHADLRDMALRFGDALLVYGSRARLKVLGSEPDFLVLTEEAQEVLRLDKAPLAALIMVGILVPVILGWVPIAVAALLGALLMVLTQCLTMEEAYRFIDWKAVFLIAGMLPLGIAMEQTGAAGFLAGQVVSLVGGLGPYALIAGIYLLTTVSTQVMPNAAVAVLLAPIALNTAADLGLSPYGLMMVVALAASASFLSPVAHPANVLIMGPGGYRFRDYFKVGLPLTLLVLAVVLLVLPLVWPLVP